jgi:hypothetical protein
MGRPRKRPRHDVDDQPQATESLEPGWESIVNPPLRPDLGPLDAWMNPNGDATFQDLIGDQSFQSCSGAQFPSLQNGLSGTLDNVPEQLQFRQALDLQDPQIAPRSGAFRPSPLVNIANPNPSQVCSCLPTISTTLGNIQALRAYHFPSSLWPLREAVHSIATVVNCTVCPKERGSSIQNIMLLQTVLTCLVERYHGFIAFIDAEAERVDSSSGTLPIRLGDQSREYAHLHTFTPDCPMGVTVDVAGKEWRVLARKAVKAQIEGSGKTLLGLMDTLERRQKKWHTDPEMEKLRHFSVCENKDSKSRNCLSHLGDIRKQAGRLIND